MDFQYKKPENLVLNSITNRIKELEGYKNQEQVAKLLGFNPTTFTERKKHQSIPFKEIWDYCQKKSINFEYILTGSPSLEVTEAPEGIPRTLPEKPPLEALSNTIRLQEDLLKSKDETIHLQRELLAAHKSISDLEARLQKLEESNKELEKLREENTSLKKEIAAQEGLGEGESQLAS